MTQSVNILKQLTQTTFDSAEGYRKASEKAESPALKRVFGERAERRTQTLEKLNNGLRLMDEAPISSVSMTGSAHHTFLSITEAVSNGDKAAVERVDEGEKYIADQFRDALNDDDVDTMNLSVRTLLQDAYNEISKSKRIVDMLEDQYA